MKLPETDALRISLRQIEKDHKPTSVDKKSKPNTAKAATTSAEKSDIEELKGMVKQLTQKVTALEDQKAHIPQYSNTFSRGNRGGGRRYNDRSRPHYQQRPTTQQPSWYRNQYQPQQPEPTQEQHGATGGQSDIQCRRCGQYGHIQIGCRVRLDHSRRTLNFRRPMRRGPR